MTEKSAKRRVVGINIILHDGDHPLAQAEENEEREQRVWVLALFMPVRGDTGDLNATPEAGQVERNNHYQLDTGVSELTNDNAHSRSNVW